MKDDPRVDTKSAHFLARTYELKAIADYETGPGSHISAETAREAIDSAKTICRMRWGLDSRPVKIRPLPMKAPARNTAAQSGFGPTTSQRWRWKSFLCSSASAGRRSASASIRPPAAAGV